MDRKTAQNIVIQWYSKAKEPSLSYLLNRYSIADSGGVFFRPFIVAALMIKAEQKTLVKADVAQWEINENAFNTLLQMQLADDKVSGLNIRPELSVDSLLSNNSGTQPGIGIMII